MRGGRPKKGTSVVVAVLVAVGLAGLVAVYFLQGQTDPFRTTPVLDVVEYLNDSHNLIGNIYRMEAEIEQLLAQSENGGRLLAVRCGQEKVAVLVPQRFHALNVQKGQIYVFVVEVRRDGLLQVKDLIKS